ncbi:MAG: ABC transporter substrate-binding protein [Vallitalea sp.]|jgi:ABC-type Fe3+ transport system substrate-binding protein|nr:ABC transporter substrate-binding protein [Vallitalea sp.]
MGKYFDIKDSLYDITNNYPETIDLFISIGFENMKDDKQRSLIGKAISLETALKMKKINVNVFTENLVDAIEHSKAINDETDKATSDNANVKIEGILPCPVRIPLMEEFTKWMESTGKSLGIQIDYELKAASMGVDWLKDSLEKAENADVLSDVFISAGFDLFFDKRLIGKFKSQGVFEDITGFENYNKDFDNEEIILKDPDSSYSMIGVVPAVFLVNTEELNGRKVPTSWEDILNKEFENSVSLPIGDFDLFNAILLNIHNRYGEEGVRKLGKSLLKSMHPSEMVKSHRKKIDKPAVTIMPYFFTKMTKRGGPMTAVWPADGAIISPIFLLAKKDKKDLLKPVVDFFASKTVGEILSHNGKFPSIHPEVDNMISSEHKYMWIGWDYIKNNDIGQLIEKCEGIFNEVIKE